MDRGRKPTPTALKLVRDNPGNRPLNGQEPVPSGEARKPGVLSQRASEIWDQYAPDLEAQGVLTSWDSHTFALWCELAAEFERDKDRMVAARISQMRALGSSFGMDPSSRSRIAANGGKPRNPADGYFD